MATLPKQYIPKGSDPLIEKFINCLMQQGKKSTARKIFSDAIEVIKSRTKDAPMDIFSKALLNATPLVEVRPKRIAGAVYQVPTEVPGQGVLLAPARFVGVDGPRWFLRGLLTGPAAVDDAAAAPLLEAMRDVAVHRGTEPMAVRDPLPLVLPADAVRSVDELTDAPGLAMPERGPEITETR